MKNLDLLIKAGADVNHQDNFGNSPMIYAASFGRSSIVLRLLEAGADYRIRNNDGDDLAYMTALFEVPNDPSATRPDCKKVIAFLEGKGVDMRPARKKVDAWHRSNPHWKEFPSGR